MGKYEALLNEVKKLWTESESDEEQRILFGVMTLLDRLNHGCDVCRTNELIEKIYNYTKKDIKKIEKIVRSAFV